MKAKRPSGRDATEHKTADFSIEDTAVTLTRLGLLQGKTTAMFDPYQGALKPKSSARKKDLRKVGAWIEAKRMAEEVKRQEAAAVAQAKGAESEEP